MNYQAILALKKRRKQNFILTIFASIFTFFGLLVLAWIIATILFKASSAFSLNLFSTPTSFGGLANAFLGQLEVVFFASIIGISVGLLAGVWLSEYAKSTMLANTLSGMSDALMSTPSIVVGVFIYAAVVVPSGGYSGWAGSLALAFMMVGVVLKVTADMLSLVPKELREAAFALGATRVKCITGVVFLGAKNALITGIILAIARVAGETAPLLWTSANNDFFTFDMSGAMPSLSVSIYDFSQMPDPELNAVAWAGAAVLSGFILSVNILTKFMFLRSKNGNRN